MTTPVQPPRRGQIWPVLVFGLIMLNMAIVAITVFAAARDPSVATEPDYYAKALNFNDTLRQREANSRLGWSAACSLRAGDGRNLLVVALRDRAGEPVDSAGVSAVAFASVRSAQRQALTLAPSGSAAGEYASPIRIDRPGVWIVRVSAERAPDTFTCEVELMVPAPRDDR